MFRGFSLSQRPNSQVQNVRLKRSAELFCYFENRPIVQPASPQSTGFHKSESKESCTCWNKAQRVPRHGGGAGDRADEIHSCAVEDARLEHHCDSNLKPKTLTRPPGCFLFPCCNFASHCNSRTRLGTFGLVLLCL